MQEIGVDSYFQVLASDLGVQLGIERFCVEEGECVRWTGEENRRGVPMYEGHRVQRIQLARGGVHRARQMHLYQSCGHDWCVRIEHQVLMSSADWWALKAKLARGGKGSGKRLLRGEAGRGAAEIPPRADS